jgi:acetylornithine deacetylase
VDAAALRRLIRSDRLDALLEEAVNTYSPPFAEDPATRVFARFLEEAGISYQRQPVAGGADTGGASRANLVVRVGPQPPALLWLGHVDTVVAVDEDHASARIEEGILHGLGSADMKSGCAAALEALRVLLASGAELHRGLCLALVVGEEEAGDGAEALAREVSAPLAVIGEPTGLAPCLEHFGYVECELAAAGARAHAALPEVGSSAIHAMMDWLLAVLDARRELERPERIAFNPRAIHGGGDMFAVAERCTASLDVHMAPELDPALVGEVVERARLASLDRHPGCRLTAEQAYSARGYRVAPDDPALEPVRAALAEIGLPFEPASFRSHSDASPLYHRGTTPVVCGPGRLEVAHTPHEHVALAEVHRAAALYATLFFAVCCRPL